MQNVPTVFQLCAACYVIGPLYTGINWSVGESFEFTDRRSKFLVFWSLAERMILKFAIFVTVFRLNRGFFFFCLIGSYKGTFSMAALAN